MAILGKKCNFEIMHCLTFVTEPIKRFKFKIADQLVTKIDEPAFAIRLEDGFYNPVCKSEGSNPPAIVKIYFDNTEYLGEPQIVKKDNSRNQSSILYNVEKRVTIKLRPNENNKILKCVAKVNTDITIIAEMSYQLTVFSSKYQHVILKLLQFFAFNTHAIISLNQRSIYTSMN